MKEIPFTKYHGAGNDFVLVDANKCKNLMTSSLAKRLCDRRVGIGADGLVLWHSLSASTHRMRIFNADGSEPTMCGNGAYCLLEYILSQGFTLPLTLETAHGLLECRQIKGSSCIHLGSVERLYFPLQQEQEPPCYVVHTGVPHAVLFYKDISTLNLEEEGKKWRWHSAFFPEGVNVNFVRVCNQKSIQVRTYERGVEAETLACGTGSAAAAFVAHHVYHLETSLDILTRKSFESSTEYHPLLQMHLSQETQSMWMQGHAEKLFTGVWH